MNPTQAASTVPTPSMIGKVLTIDTFTHQPRRKSKLMTKYVGEIVAYSTSNAESQNLETVVWLAGVSQPIRIAVDNGESATFYFPMELAR